MNPLKLMLLFLFLFCQNVWAQEMVFVFLHQRADKAELPKAQLDSIMSGHMANIGRLAKEGKLLVAGPFDGGGGIFIFNSKSVEEVKRWLQTDPGMAANQWKVELQLYQWRIGQPRLVNEPIEMTSYQFVRFVPYIAKFNINEVPELFNKHDNYLKEIKQTGNVVAEGIFGNSEGGVLVMRGELNRAVIEADPAVNAGLLEIEIKKWYCAKGAFGEK